MTQHKLLIVMALGRSPPNPFHTKKGHKQRKQAQEPFSGFTCYLYYDLGQGLLTVAEGSQNQVDIARNSFENPKIKWSSVTDSIWMHQIFTATMQRTE